MSGWFVLNMADAPATAHERAGAWFNFEAPDARFPHYGLNVHVLEPGQPNAKYHAETMQEDFLVLHGSCLAIVEGEERTLRQWDLLHCPPGVAHVLVGAGDGPCAILMIGARGEGKRVDYPVEPVAARHGASVERATSSPPEAYADWTGEFREVRLDWPIGASEG